MVVVSGIGPAPKASLKTAKDMSSHEFQKCIWVEYADKHEIAGRYGDQSGDYAALKTRVRQLELRLAMYEREVRGLREVCKMLHYESLSRQNDRGRRRLKEVFGSDPTGSVSARSLDGMLKDFVRPGEDSRDLVRFARDRR